MIVREAARAIAWYEEALGAEMKEKLEGPGGRIGHAEMQLGDAVFMLADEVPDMGIVSPLASEHRPPVKLLVYVPDVDAAYRRAIELGAVEDRPVQDQFYGDRTGSIVDPFGHCWTLATHLEDVPPEELQRRFQALLGHAKE